MTQSSATLTTEQIESLAVNGYYVDADHNTHSVFEEDRHTLRDLCATALAKASLGAEPVAIPKDFVTTAGASTKAFAYKEDLTLEHAPWYVVLPNSAMLRLGYHANDEIDKAHAEFIADAINYALSSPTPTVDLPAATQGGETPAWRKYLISMAKCNPHLLVPAHAQAAMLHIETIERELAALRPPSEHLD